MASTNLMENIDKISSSTFFQSGQFSVAITSKLGRKGTNGVRYGSFREQNYQLKTVADQPFVKSFDISNISDYLVFAFKGNIDYNIRVINSIKGSAPLILILSYLMILLLVLLPHLIPFY